MASLINVRLNRGDASPWGFRLQGGKDFGTPLVIQKVNGNSLAEKAGLQVGDAVIRVNGQEVFNLRHKDAQDIIVRSGNNIEISIQRGGAATWKPAVQTVGGGVAASPHLPSNVAPVTKTSLAATKPAGPTGIGSSHNLSPRPFNQVNGGEPVKSIVNKQYNSPVNIYSEQTIAETLSAQAEVLAGGVLGVNFKKNERGYDAEKSEVYKMLQEAEREPKTPEPDVKSSTAYYSSVSHATGGRAVSPRPMTPIAQQMNLPLPPQTQAPPYMPSGGPASSSRSEPPKCSGCGKTIVGVFVRIKDKNLHVECFKCATCGSSLKNIGYYSINNKLYCDIHAKLVARQNPPGPNMDPITVPPQSSGFPPSSAAAPASPQSNLAPLPFHTPRVAPSHVAAPRPVPKSSGSTNTVPKPFSSVQPPSAPYQPPAAPYQPPAAPYQPPAAPYQPPAAPAPPAPAPAPAPPAAAPFYNKPQSGYSPFSTYRKGAPTTSVPPTGAGAGGGSAGNKGATFAGSTAPRRGRGTLNAGVAPGARIPLCGSCNSQIRGPFITALGKIWCPEHFVCANVQCKRPLQDVGFVEESSGLYCEFCFEQFLAPACNKCNKKIKGDCLNAIGKHFHPECFCCAYCGKLFGNSPFFLEDALPYCENDWNELFTTKCFSCGFPIEAGDRWVEALANNYHSQCFNCTMCKKNLEGQSFFAKGGRPFCKNHAR
ncbi:PDZ and LIM domain protein Zasp isoform X14 [Nilaparvata lugens]|uniref:PDZ and LIM domain protein Zasp isoform X14 n=1 Tax=Nilaparvata lugens TaxID=108931 RepID=UPI00193E8923|nr:PDZ and LIM domain protein Zasp isoform X14 [Nilaparvata lugens]